MQTPEEKKLKQKECAAKWYRKNKEVYLESRKAYKAAWFQKNKERLLAKSNAAYHANREERLAQQKEYNKKNPEVRQAWRERNRADINEKARVYQKERRAKDPAFKILMSCRNRIRTVLLGICKSAKSLELIGCSPDELKQYLEKQFKPGMTWENYGSYWHIDHIIPCFQFDLNNPEEQKKCFHFSNLQPLEALENLKKNRF